MTENNCEFVLRVEQSYDLEVALNRSGGWNPHLFKRLCDGRTLSFVRDCLLGYYRMVPQEYRIDCDRPPSLPPTSRSDLVVKHHIPMDSLILTGDNDRLFVGRASIVPFVIDPCSPDKFSLQNVAALLAKKRVLNGCVLDFLLDHPTLIPDEWKKGTRLLFWNTQYWGKGNWRGASRKGSLFIKSLYWDSRDGCWSFTYTPIEKSLSQGFRVAVLSF